MDATVALWDSRPLNVVILSLVAAVSIGAFTFGRRCRRRSATPVEVTPAEATLAEPPTTATTVPESVNYHFTRRCNYQCGFCFHTAKTGFELPLEDAKRGLKLLRDAGWLYRIRSYFRCRHRVGLNTSGWSGRSFISVIVVSIPIKKWPLFIMRTCWNVSASDRCRKPLIRSDQELYHYVDN